MAACKSYWMVEKLKEIKKTNPEKINYDKTANATLKKFHRYQSAEYNAIIARSRTAKQYMQFADTADVFPNLVWILSRSNQPRVEHLSYVGYVYPKNSMFAKKNQPGQLYGCKCDIEETDAEVTDTQPETILPAKGLEGNPIDTGELITDKHPYFAYIKDELKHIPDIGVLMQPDEIVYFKHKTEGGGIFLEHFLVRKEQETKNNRILAGLLADKVGKEIKLLPQIHVRRIDLRNRYYGVEYSKLHPTKCPDAIMDDEIIEFKTAVKKRMSERILEASTKANIVFLSCKDEVSEKYIQHFIDRQWRMEDRKNIIQIIVLNSGAVTIFKRP